MTTILSRNIVVRRELNSSMDELRGYQKLIRLLEPPFDFVVFELFDQFYYIQYHPDPEVRYLVARNPRVNAGLKLQVEEKEALLKPLYSQETTTRFAVWHPIGFENYMYSLVDIKRVARIEYSRTPAGPDAREKQITISFRRITNRFRDEFEAVIKKWRDWGASLGLIELLSPMVYDQDAAEASFTASFGPTVPAVSDCLAILYFALVQAKGKTGVTGGSFSVG
jgi:hypothetical protein